MKDQIQTLQDRLRNIGKECSEFIVHDNIMHRGIHPASETSSSSDGGHTTSEQSDSERQSLSSVQAWMRRNSVSSNGSNITITHSDKPFNACKSASNTWSMEAENDNFVPPIHIATPNGGNSSTSAKQSGKLYLRAFSEEEVKEKMQQRHRKINEGEMPESIEKLEKRLKK